MSPFKKKLELERPKLIFAPGGPTGQITLIYGVFIWYIN